MEPFKIGELLSLSPLEQKKFLKELGHKGVEVSTKEERESVFYRLLEQGFIEGDSNTPCPKKDV